MNKLKTYFAVILYLATNSVYADRGFESTVSHMLGPLSTIVCGFVEPKKSELEKFIEVSGELDCSNEKDVNKHCACIKKVEPKPLSTPMENKFLAELGFFPPFGDPSSTKLLRDLSNYNSLLGAYSSDPAVKLPLSANFFSCLNPEELDQIEKTMKDNFLNSADTKIGVPALYDSELLKKVRSTNNIKLMDLDSKVADAEFIRDIASFIAKNEGESSEAGILLRNSDGADVLAKRETFWKKEPGDYSHFSNALNVNTSTVTDSQRASMVSDFLSNNSELGLKYSKSPLYKVYTQTYERSQLDISDYLGRVATKSGMVNNAKSKITQSIHEDQEAIEKAAYKLPTSVFLRGECERLKSELKRNVSSSFRAALPDSMVTVEGYTTTMSYEKMLLSQQNGRYILTGLGPFDPNTMEGRTNTESLSFYRQRFIEQYRKNLEVFDDEKAEYLLKVKDFNFSQLICSKIEVDEEVEKVVFEIGKDKNSSGILEKILETKEKVAEIDEKIVLNQLRAVSLNSEKSNLIADNSALESRKAEASKKVEKATQSKGRYAKSTSIIAKGTIESTTKAIELNNSRIAEIDLESKKKEEVITNLEFQKDLLTSSFELPSLKLEPLNFDLVKSTAKDPYTDSAFRKRINETFLGLEIDEFVEESSDGIIAPKRKTMLTGNKDIPKAQIISENIETGEFELITKSEEIKRIAKADADLLSTQSLSILDNKGKITASEAQAFTEIVRHQSKKTINILKESQIKKTETREPIVEKVTPALKKLVDVNSSAETVAKGSEILKLASKGAVELVNKSAANEDLDHVKLSSVNEQVGENGPESSKSVGVNLAEYMKNNPIKGINQGVSLVHADIGNIGTAAVKDYSTLREVFNSSRDDHVESAKAKVNNGVSKIAKAFTTGGIFSEAPIDSLEDIEQLGEGLAEATRKKLEERGIDISGISSKGSSSSGFYENTKEANELEQKSRLMRREVASKKGKLKGMQIGNIGLSKDLASQKRVVSKMKDYSSNINQFDNTNYLSKNKKNENKEDKEITIKNEEKENKEYTEIGRSKPALFPERQNIDQPALSGLEPESKRIAKEITREVQKAGQIRQAIPRSIGKSSSSPRKVGSAVSQGGSSGASSSTSAGTVSKDPSSPAATGRSIASVKTPRKENNLNFDNKVLALNEKSYAVTPVLEGVDSDLYLRLPSFDTPENFLDYSAENRNKWIAEQFKSSKALEAIIVLPSGQKVLVKKKD